MPDFSTESPLALALGMKERKREFQLREEDKKAQAEALKQQRDITNQQHQDALDEKIRATLQSEQDRAQYEQDRQDSATERKREFDIRMAETKSTKKDIAKADKDKFLAGGMGLLQGYQKSAMQLDQQFARNQGLGLRPEQQQALDVANGHLKAQLQQQHLQAAQSYFLSHPEYANDPAIAQFRQSIYKQLGYDENAQLREVRGQLGSVLGAGAMEFSGSGGDNAQQQPD